MARIVAIVAFAIAVALAAGCAPASAPNTAAPADAKTLQSPATDLSEATRKQIYWDLVVAQDKGIGDEESYAVVARKYGVTEEAVRKIAAEGTGKMWPIPTAPD